MKRVVFFGVAALSLASVASTGCGGAEPAPRPPEPPRPVAPLARAPACAPGTSLVDGACKVTGPCADNERDCDDKCEAKDAASCLSAARIHGAMQAQSGGPPAPKDGAKAQERALRACDLGSPEGCVFAGRVAITRRDLAREERDKVTAAAWTKACEAGHVQSCGYAASALRFGPQKDLAKARAMLDKACASTAPGKAMACHSLADLAFRGEGAAADPAKGAELMERACAASSKGDGVGICREWGERLGSGDGAPKDPGRAIAAFERGCDAGDGRACASLGAAQRAGKLAAKDLAKARASFEKGCAPGMLMRGDACLGLGEMLEQGQGGAKDAKAALERYTAACEQPFGTEACVRASAMHAKGVGTPKDEKAAMDVLVKGCKRARWREGREICDKAAATLGKKDKAQAAALWQERCERQADGHACAKWKALGGAPSEKLMADRAKMAQSFCDAKDGEACRAWKELGGTPTAEQLKLPARKLEPPRRRWFPPPPRLTAPPAATPPAATQDADDDDDDDDKR